MDMFDLIGAFEVPGSGRRRERTSEESIAELAGLLFLPLAEVIAALFLKLALQPMLAMVILPALLATLAYPISTRIGTGRAFALGLAVRTFFVCMLIGGCAMIFLALIGFFATF